MTNLPMLGLTHGNRSAVTCHLKCDSQCSRPDPNPSTEPTFAEIAGRQLSRRAVLAGSGALAAAAALPVVWPERAAAAPKPSDAGPLAFTGIDPVSAEADTLAVPTGYQWTSIIRWGDPLFAGSPAFDPNRPDAKAQELQFGYNNDYVDILVDPRGRTGPCSLQPRVHRTGRSCSRRPRRGRGGGGAAIAMAAHGFVVVKLERAPRQAAVARPSGVAATTAASPRTRRSRLDGPAAGSRLCCEPPPTRPAAGSSARSATAPAARRRGAPSCPARRTSTATSGPTRPTRGSKRYGLTQHAAERLRLGDDRPALRRHDERVRRTRPTASARSSRSTRSTRPRPRSSTRRSAASSTRAPTSRSTGAGTAVAYMGDDERFDYLYKFVARQDVPHGQVARRPPAQPDPADRGRPLRRPVHRRRHRPTATSTAAGTWVPLVLDGRVDRRRG